MVTRRTKAACRAAARSLRQDHAEDPPVSFLPTLLRLPAFIQARALALFLPHGVEPRTDDILAHAHRQGARTGVPAWCPDGQTYRFCDLRPDEPLAPGRLGIPEPREKRWTAATDYTLILIPGLRFDTQGTRIGHGKGYYDRLLADRAPHTVLAALAFDWQIDESPLPREAHDVAMHVIITPTRLIPTR